MSKKCMACILENYFLFLRFFCGMGWWCLKSKSNHVNKWLLGKVILCTADHNRGWSSIFSRPQEKAVSIAEILFQTFETAGIWPCIWPWTPKWCSSANKSNCTCVTLCATIPLLCHPTGEASGRPKHNTRPGKTKSLISEGWNELTPSPAACPSFQHKNKCWLHLPDKSLSL